jgi:hypothetical protein
MSSRRLAVFIGAIVVCGLLVAAPSQKHHLIVPQDESGVYGYKDTPIQPWSGFHVHDPDRPIPKRIDPGPPQPAVPPPADAVVLFDGKDLSKWNPLPWTIDDGCLVADKGLLTSKEEFGDCQLHLEWMTPDPPAKDWGNRGNNGVFLLKLFEIQIYDSYTTQIYPDGQAAAIYAQTPPLVNACRKPGQWQTYDIVLTVPVYEGDKMISPPRVTMFHNGLLVHLNDEVYGTTPHAGLAQFPAEKRTQGPIALMGHHCPVRFRNIWVRPLDLKSNKTMAKPEK